MRMVMVMVMAAAGTLALGTWGLSLWAEAGMSGGCCSDMAGMHHAAATAPAPTTAPATQPTTQKATYVCPMHADVVSDKPGKCPKCGMDLVKK